MKRKSAASVLALAIVLAFWSVSLSPPAAAQRGDLLVMVANKNDTAITNLSKSEVKELLLGEKTSWPGGAKVMVVLGTVGSPERTMVLEKVCGMSEAEYTRHNLQATFMGETVASVYQAPSAAAIRNFVKTNRGAVGFLHQSELDANLKAVWSVD